MSMVLKHLKERYRFFEYRLNHALRVLRVQYARFLRGNLFLIIIAVLIGLATGAVILLFNWSVEFAGDWFGELFTMSGEGMHWTILILPLIPAFGGLLVGLLNTYFFQTTPSHGVPEVILATRFARGKIRKRTILQKLVTASLSIGSGGGGGREGPIIHVGAAVGVSIANLLQLSRDQIRTLIACGAAAGISGIFNAPIGGVMFVLEVILGDFRVKTFTPVVVASVAATAFTRNFYGDTTLVYAPSDYQILPVDYLFFVLLGILVGLFSAYFTFITRKVEKISSEWFRLHAAIRPALGGLASGCMLMFLPALMEQSYQPINTALQASLPLWMLLLVACIKPIHAAVTIGSGGTGGMFAPAMKSGAMLGAAFGILLVQLFPDTIHSPTPYALAAMGAILSGTMHAPLTAILMIMEISDDYSIVLPAMLTSILSILIAQRFVKPSIYTWPIESTAYKLGSYAYVPTLNAVTIEEIIDRSVERVSPNAPLNDVLEMFETSSYDAILVVSSQGRYLGLIEFEDVRSFITDVSSTENLVAMDVMVTSVRPVHPETTMDVVLTLFDQNNWSVLPVVESGEAKTALGTVSSSDAHRFFRKSVARET